MLASTAHVATERPSFYLKQLCEHFAHERRRHSAPEVEVTFDDHEGFVNFAPVVSGICRLDARQERVLVIEASGTDQAALERVQRLLTERGALRTARRLDCRMAPGVGAAFDGLSGVRLP